MLDIHFIRKNKELVERTCREKKMDVDLSYLLDLDEKRRSILKDIEEKKHKRNVSSKLIGKLKKEGKNTDDVMREMKVLSEEIKKQDEHLSNLENEIREIMESIPNVPLQDVPWGGEENNKVIYEYGEKKVFEFKPRRHDVIAENLGLVDFKRGAKISGSGFLLFRKYGALLERALINFMIDTHTEENGFEEVSPPFLVNRKSMFGTGQLPKLEEDMYGIENGKFFLVPTAEVPVTNIFANEVLNEKDLPKKFVAYSPCFRREAGSYGKETIGMMRVHQFDKVELVKIVRPEDSESEHKDLLNCSESILKKLGLHYRVVLLAVGDMSFAAAKCYDIEVWAPGMDKYLEVSSCSNFMDFQARRMKMRFKRKNGGKMEYPHTLNSSGLALPRTVIAIIENNQNEDGSVNIPDVLIPYMKGIRVLK